MDKQAFIHDLGIIPAHWLIVNGQDTSNALPDDMSDRVLLAVETTYKDCAERKRPLETCFEEDIAALKIIAALNGDEEPALFAKLSDETYNLLRKDIVKTLRKNGFSNR